MRNYKYKFIKRDFGRRRRGFPAPGFPNAATVRGASAALDGAALPRSRFCYHRQNLMNVTILRATVP
jgi:hypothetical protein